MFYIEENTSLEILRHTWGKAFGLVCDVYEHICSALVDLDEWGMAVISNVAIPLIAKEQFII